MIILKIADTQATLPTKRNENVVIRVAVVSALLGFFALVAFLLWLAVADFNEAGSEAKVLAAALALIGVLVTQAIALIGLLIKRSVDERTLSVSKAAEDRLRSEGERNNALQQADRNVNRVKTVGEFFQYLASPDAREKEAALVLIGELGDPRLALRLAAIYRAEGGLGAIARLTQSTDAGISAAATVVFSKVLASSQ